MIYLAPRKTGPSRAVRTLIAIVILIVVLCGAVQFLRPYFFPQLASAIARPFWRVEFAVNAGALNSPSELLAANQALLRQIVEDQVKLAGVQATLDENTELKSLLGRASSSPYILAAVLSRPPLTNLDPLSTNDELIIDAGADHHFVAGNQVFAPGNVPIGRISSVFSETSRVVLYSSPGKTFPVLIGTTHAPATAIGRGGGQYSADLPRGVSVAAGDYVLDSSLSNGIFGTVRAVLSDPAQSFETVLFAPPVNVYSIRFVLVDNRTTN